MTLELRHITQRFGATEVLRGVDLIVAKGERHALIGPNGAGKSTLFDLIAGRIAPSGGKVIMNGIDVTGMPPHRLSKLGLARSFQSTRIFGNLTVANNLRCAALGAGHTAFMDRWIRSARIDREAGRVMASMGLLARANDLASSLGYAEQRALDLGIALATGAAILLLDEPTAGMNRAESRRALDLIRTSTEGRTLLIVEHDMEAVFALADRISVLVQGRVIATGTAAEIRANALVREAYLGNTP
jgi:branched-chain amino acid transport system ATP-binding protein